MRKVLSGAIVAILAVGAAAVLVPSSRPVTLVAPTNSIPPSLRTSIPEAPTPTPTPAPVLRADGMASIAAPGGVVVWSAPGTERAKALKPALPTGARLFLTRGPRHAHGTDWWEAQAEFRPATLPPLFGWVQAMGITNQPALVPFAPTCPPVDRPLDSRFIEDLGTLEALACFGHRDLTVQGTLSCYDAAVDPAVGGASWLATNYACSMEGSLWLDGPVVSGLLAGVPGSVVGRYEVRGHFDDPEASGCSWIPFGTTSLTPSGHPDPGAVIICRQAFVVTAVAKLP